jgi:hypothetical protein
MGSRIHTGGPIPLFVEGCAGLGAVSLQLQHGRHCKPPVSRMGSKSGYGLALLRVMGLRPGQGAEQYLWCEPDAGCRALLTAYTDPALMREAAEIIRGWKDEDPRALWERLRAEGPIRGFDAREVGRQVLVGAWSFRACQPDSGFRDPYGGLSGSAKASGAGSDGLTMGGMVSALSDIAAASELARYLQVTASNRLITLDPSTMKNTGQGGTTFGGDEFATSAEKVSEAAREVARWVGVGHLSYRSMEPESGFNPGMASDSSSPCWRPTLDAVGAGLLSLGLPATIVPDARDIHPPPLPPGCVVYFDPPYIGTTGYGNDLTRAEVCEMAERWASAGAAVYISEAEPIADLDGWHSVEITSTRVGQKRTFSTERGRTEWLTCNREPAWRPAVQQRLFG